MDAVHRKIVVLAKSYKPGGFCIAGKDLRTGQWIRPVSTAEGGSITDTQSKLTFVGSSSRRPWSCQTLNNVVLPLQTHAPLSYQPENHVIDVGHWRQEYNTRRNELLQYVDEPSDLWGEGDRISTHVADSGLDASLYLVRVSDLRLYVTAADRPRAAFVYQGIRYDFACTDPQFAALAQQQAQHEHAVLCVSMSMPFYGHHFKLVAAVYVNETRGASR